MQLTWLRWLGFSFFLLSRKYHYLRIFILFFICRCTQGTFFLTMKYFCHIEIPTLHWRLPRNSSQRLTSAIIWPRESLFKVHCSQTIFYPRDSFDPLDVIPFGNLTHLGYITLNIEDSTCHFNILCQSTYNKIIVKSSKTYLHMLHLKTKSSY